MAEAATKLPIKSETRTPFARHAEPAGLEGFWNEMERLFDNFGFGLPPEKWSSVK